MLERDNRSRGKRVMGIKLKNNLRHMGIKKRPHRTLINALKEREINKI